MERSPDKALHSLLDTMVDGVITISEHGVIELYNDACEKIFGYSSDEVYGKNISILMPEPYRENHDDYIKQYRKTKKAKIIGIGRKVSGLRKNGDVFPMYLSVGENTSDETGGYVGVIRDLTDETESAEKYNRLQQEYFHLSRVAAMNQMGTAIAHELNQPLAAVMNYIQAAQASLKNEQTADLAMLQNIMEKSAAQVERAAITLSRLRRFIQSGDVEKQNFDLLEVIQTSVNLVMLNYKADAITVSYDFANDAYMAFGSDVQIQQVLVNLIRNACEAMQESHDKKLTISVMRGDDKSVKVGVLDNGSGLTDKTMETLFEPFTSEKEDGLGVGLSISQSIISNHEGRLWAEHNPIGGTAFYFTVPASAK